MRHRPQAGSSMCVAASMHVLHHGTGVRIKKLGL